jgi:CHAD domain-containing protein
VSERGELVAFDPPLEKIRAALRGQYSAIGAGATGVEVRDDLDKLVCRISVLVAPGDSFWLTLDPLKGYRRDAERIRDRLLASGFLSEDDWKSPQVRMAPGERSDVVVARVLLRLLEIQDANLPGALADTHVEFLHDYRVAIRRTRSVLREMQGVFAPADFESLKTAFKWLQDQTSATRDLDVYLEDFEHLRALAPPSVQADLGPIEPLLRERHRRARAAMVNALTGGRARELHDDWANILGLLVLQSEADRPDASRPIGKLAAHRIRKVHRKMVKMGRRIEAGGTDSPPEDYHELRKKGKELRYLLELFGAQLFDPDVVTPMIKVLKGMQDVLGLHQDREVQIAMLKELAQELVSRPGGAGALMAVGTLIERLEADAHEARGEFAAVFADFASDAQCKLVARAFS